MTKVNKSQIERLVCEYNCKSKNKIKLQFNGNTVQLIFSKSAKEMKLDEAHAFLHECIKALHKPVTRRGKGYVGNSMSVNAQNAHANNITPKSYFTAKRLNELGFQYPYEFFKWLVERQYILPKEWHHTSAARKYTRFYSDDSIRYAVEMMNLDILYKLYNKEITEGEAKRIRGIKYAKVKMLDTLIGGKSGNAITVNTIICDGFIFISDKRCFLEDDQRLAVSEIYSERPSDFRNDRLGPLSNKLIKRKTKSFMKYLNVNF